MGRKLERVPMDFNYPIGKIWYGYFLKPVFCHSIQDKANYCENCKAFAVIKGIPLETYGCPKYREHFSIQPSIEPPSGDGYQLWETTTEGSPQSPVFATLDELSEWCEENATTFGDNKATKEAWKTMLEADFVHHTEGSVTFI